MSHPTPGPTARQWRVVRDAIERFTGEGRYRLVAPVTRALPQIEFRWIDPSHPPTDFPIERAAASTTIFNSSDDIALVSLRLDITERALLRSTIHELQHAADLSAIRSGRMSEAVYEARARDTAERLLSLGTVP
jgi:hypothetical protein